MLTMVCDLGVCAYVMVWVELSVDSKLLFISMCVMWWDVSWGL